LSKALRRAVDPFFLDVDQMQRGRLRRLQDVRGKLAGPDADFGADRALGHEFEHGHAVAEAASSWRTSLAVRVSSMNEPGLSVAIRSMPRSRSLA
jgi:hypothetical protein